MKQETLVKVCTNSNCHERGNTETANQLQTFFADRSDVRVQCVGCLRGCKESTVPSIDIEHADYSTAKLRGDEEVAEVIDRIDGNITKQVQS